MANESSSEASTSPTPAMRAGDSATSLLRVQGLHAIAPGGRKILENVDLELHGGEVVVLLGGSGSGKSTLMGALDDPERLRRAGFTLEWKSRELATPVGLVPQRGALFDHLDVAGNLALAMRNAATPQRPTPESIGDALEGVDLPRTWASERRGVEGLSGGEAQRVAVARTLAGGRRILFCDEPSVGLDPLRVDRLADLLRAEVAREGATALVVTHELAFAAGVADRFVYMDRERRTLVELPIEALAGVDPAAPRSRLLREAIASEVAAASLARLDAESKDDGASPRPPRPNALLTRIVEFSGGLRDSFGVAPRVLRSLLPALARPRDLLEVSRLAARQTMLRPSPFFVIVSLLIGMTILYILHRALGGGELPLRADRVFSLIGSMHVIALAPPLAGILFAATAGNAITAWLGGVSLTRQDEALRGLGIDATRYLWVPAFGTLVVAFLALASVFTLGMLGGGVVYLATQVPELGGDLARSWELVSADLLDPPADRAVFRVRMVGLMCIYAVGIASDAVAKGAKPKASAESVTVSMVRGVMATTLWIVAFELLSLLAIFGGGAG